MSATSCATSLPFETILHASPPCHFATRLPPATHDKMKASQAHTQHASNAPSNNNLEVCHPQEHGEEPQSQSHTEATVTTRKKRKNPEQRSSRWADYTVIEVEVGDPPILKKKAKCNRCGTLIATDSSRNDTIGLKNHTEVCKRKHEASGDQAKLSFLHVLGDGNRSGALSIWKFNQKESKLALCEMIILDGLPLIRWYA
ncbi:uncharacterized protein LOC131012240 [Salvia miltiorrhiza]|uniref:uncharacterized protein LOC131012240 n=1 Tax=Salvia miltiorrhiza TaxID=226208 RepID=UPI0025AC6CFB|nr:uncharacterized protein LOC131012240 [Salvia miltiorrhiza]